MKPVIGQIVHYKTADHDLSAFSPQGNVFKAGLILPAIVVAVWSDTCANLKVIGDGPSDAWLTSRTQGDGEGQWQVPLSEDVA